MVQAEFMAIDEAQQELLRSDRPPLSDTTSQATRHDHTLDPSTCCPVSAVPLCHGLRRDSSRHVLTEHPSSLPPAQVFDNTASAPTTIRCGPPKWPCCPWYPDKISRARPSTPSSTHATQTTLDKHHSSSTRQAQGSRAEHKSPHQAAGVWEDATARPLPFHVYGLRRACHLPGHHTTTDNPEFDVIGAQCTDRCCAPRCPWCPCGAQARPHAAARWCDQQG